MTREKVNITSNHEISFGTTYNITHPNDTITLGFGQEWDLSTINITDLILRKGSTNLMLGASADIDTWGVNTDNTLHQIIFTAPTTNTDNTQYFQFGSAIKVFINNEKLVNPINVGNYQITMFIVSDDGLVLEGFNSEFGSVTVPIVDSDQVNLTGYVSSYLHFDIDMGTGEIPGPSVTPINCDSTGSGACSIHSGGGLGTNYTVDLGELAYIRVNKSNVSSPQHSDGFAGMINSIYFDMTTNSPSGAVVTVKSLNGGLQSPDDLIPSVADGLNIVANDGAYGFNLPVASYQLNGTGTIVKNVNCDSTLSDKYCGPSSSTAKKVFDTNGQPVDGARVRMDLAAAASYTNTPGTYTDTLTFIATSTF